MGRIQLGAGIYPEKLVLFDGVLQGGVFTQEPPTGGCRAHWWEDGRGLGSSLFVFGRLSCGDELSLECLAGWLALCLFALTFYSARSSSSAFHQDESFLPNTAFLYR
jgi:hypothetical protein